MILTENKQILERLANDLLKGFLLSEESHFEEQGLKRPYSAKVQMSKDRGIDWANVSIDRRPSLPANDSSMFKQSAARLKEYAGEFLDDTLFDVTWEFDRTFGLAVVRMSMPE